MLPVFIFNPQQIEPVHNKYFSNSSVQFMIESLIDLKRELPSLRFFYGLDTEVVNLIKSREHITHVYYNVDFTPFARKRDTILKQWCFLNSIEAVPCETDYSFVHIQTMLKPYQVFTPFFNKYSRDTVVPEPVTCIIDKRPLNIKKFQKEIGLDKVQSFYKENKNIIVRGGRSEGVAILRHIKEKTFKNYSINRDFPSDINGTTMLSAYLKYGCISIREAYHAIQSTHNNKHPLIRQLFWRVFYDQICWWFPRVLNGMDSTKNKHIVNKSLREKYDNIKWANVKSKETQARYKAWTQGTTGFPIVDAGMRQMLQTGWMHNRVRMVVASFLVKDLHIDWREGEAHFSRTLVDIYHPSNNGGWQWASGSGADSQQYNRIFNPWLQSAKYDPDAIYIKRWIPELHDVPSKVIHKWQLLAGEWETRTKYPRPIVNHKQASTTALALYKKALY
jgi:deoxyribodipyrimidine photo-lyase